MIKILEVKLLIGKEAKLNFPSGLKFDKKHNNLYICDMYNSTVRQYSFITDKIRDLPRKCSNKSIELQKPLAIAMDYNNKIIITDSIYNSLFKYIDGVWEQINIKGNIQINLPGSISCDENGNIYVSDFLNNRICIIDKFNCISIINEIDCKKPYGIFYNDNILYIIDNYRIQYHNIYTKENDILFKGDISPISITVDNGGNIYFSETRKLYLYHNKTKRIELILNNEIWQKFGYSKLCHIGAMVSISNNMLIFSDTIQNCIYQVFFNKDINDCA